jgi:hypothetical protein
MLTSHMYAELAGARQRDRIAAAEAQRIAREARRGERHTPAARVRRVRPTQATQPASA